MLPREPAPDQVAARAHLHRRNPIDWVGAAHNRALDAFRDKLREPGLLPGNLCSYLLSFTASDARLPAERAQTKAALSASARRNAAKKALATTPFCGGQLDGSSAKSGPPAWLAGFRPSQPPVASSRARRPQSGVSDAVLNLYRQIETAVDGAASSYDLARELNSVLDGAAQLGAQDYATIAATVSVAQSSSEYWETQLPSYVDAIRADYGACFEESQLLGYSLVEAQDRCMHGSQVNPVDWRGVPASPQPRLLLAVARPRSASGARQTAGQGLKTIVKRDALGAFTGAWGGVFVGGFEGAVAGAILGAGGASIATAIELVGSAMWHHQYK